jgi:4-alpha-glucanotransferase
MLLTLEEFQRRGVSNPDQPWNGTLRDALLELAYRSGSSELFATLQDVFGWRDRINVPGLVSDDNWTWRLPWPVDRLDTIAEAIERAEFCRGLGESTRRGVAR